MHMKKAIVLKHDMIFIKNTECQNFFLPTIKMLQIHKSTMPFRTCEKFVQKCQKIFCTFLHLDGTRDVEAAIFELLPLPPLVLPLLALDDVVLL